MRDNIMSVYLETKGGDVGSPSLFQRPRGDKYNLTVLNHIIQSCALQFLHHGSSFLILFLLCLTYMFKRPSSTVNRQYISQTAWKSPVIISPKSIKEFRAERESNEIRFDSLLLLVSPLWLLPPPSPFPLRPASHLASTAALPMHFPTWTPSRAPSTDVASMLKESCIAVLRRLPIKDRKIAIELAKDYHARRWIEFFEIYDQNALSQTGPTTGGVRLLVDLDEGTAEEVIALFEHEESASGAMSEETADMTSESGPAKTLLNDAAVDIHQSLEEGSMEKVSVDELGLEVTFPELQETRKTPGSETRDWSLESRDPPSSYQTPCTSPSTDIPHTTSLANLRPLPEILQDTLQEITLTVKPRKRREKKTSRAASVVSSSGLTRDSSMENLRASVDDDAAPGILKRLGTMFTWGVSAAPSPPPTASTSPETAPAADDSPPQTDPDITKKEPATKSSNSINLWGILGSRGDDDVNGPHATLAAAAAPDVQPTTTNVATASIKKKKKKIKKKKFKKELEAPVDDISDINEDATIDSGASDRNV